MGIPSQMVVKSFLKCVITNSMDGTEDHKLFSDFVASREKVPCQSVCESKSAVEDDPWVYDDKIVTEESVVWGV